MKFVLKALIILFIASPAIAEDSPPPYDPVKEIMESRTKKKKTMQSASWNTKKEKKAEPAKTEEPSPETEPAEKKKSPLWNRYKEAENNTEDKKHAPAEPKEEKSEEDVDNPDEDQSAEAEKKTSPKPAGGLAGILEKYKNSQKPKDLSSRSFGNLDR